MSRLEKMWKIFESNTSAVKPTNPKAKEILITLIDKAIPLVAYYGENDIKEAIYDDAVDEGLTASDIHDAIPKIIELGKYHNYRCMTILFGIDRIANAYLSFKSPSELARIDDED